MTVYELLKISSELLKRLHSFGIKLGDCQYVDLYEDYMRMRETGDKQTAIIFCLSEKYHVCERKVYKIIKHFQENCQFGAVE